MNVRKENAHALATGDPDFLLDQAERVLARATKQPGVKWAEVYVDFTSDLALEVENSELKKATSSVDAGFGLRVYNARGAAGFAQANTFEGAVIDAIVERAVKLMRVAPANPEFIALPDPPSESYLQIEGLADPAGLATETDEFVTILEAMIEHARVDDRMYSISCGLSAGAGTAVVVSSTGIKATTSQTVFDAWADNVAKSGSDQATGFDYDVARSLGDLNPSALARAASEQALRNLGRISVEPGEYPVILKPRAVKSIVVSAITGASNAEAVQEDRSFLRDALDREIAAPGLTISDDPTLPGRPSSAPFDDEGVRCYEKKIVDAGRLEQFLHNSYTAGKAGVQSTGNASRSGYGSLPRISSWNVAVAPGDARLEEMIEDTRAGILVERSGDRPNVVTGDFSGLLSCAYWIEAGEVKAPLKNTNLGIHLPEVLPAITLIGREREWMGSTLVPSLQIATGWISSGD